jgi:hypothetical protein
MKDRMRGSSPALIAIPLVLVAACGQTADVGQSPVTPNAPEVSAGGEAYDLHEWGLVSTGPMGFELAAGPGREAIALTIDKPVLYVHAEQEMALGVTVTAGAGMSFAEHYPLTAGEPLSWQVDVAPSACAAPRQYPSTCETPDGYCETAELPLYETADAACLTAGDESLPLLFYRMRAETPPSMPLAVRRDGLDVVVRNESWQGGIGQVWRVTWDGQSGVTHAARVTVPDVGEEVRIPMPTSGGVADARAAMRADLATHGLTAPETEAFMRAWDAALFGASGSVDEDMTTVDELSADGIPAIQGGPRIADTILYWLPQDAIDALAHIEATPAPRHLRRAILVRADAR